MMPGFMISGARFLKIEITSNFRLGAPWGLSCLSSLFVQHLA